MIKNKVGILLVEDHDLIIEGMYAYAAEANSNFKILAVARNAEETINLLKTTIGIELVLMDYKLPGSKNGADLTKEILAQFPKLKVLFCSASENGVDVARTQTAGARGFVCKYQPSGRKFEEEIKSAIGLVMKGYFVWPPSKQQMARFTPVEKEIIQLLHDGYTNYRDMAFQLLKIEHDGKTDKITAEMLTKKENNIAQHASNIMQKLGLHNIGELIRWILSSTPGNPPIEDMLKTGILLVDDYRLQVLNIFNLLLENKTDYQIVAHAESGKQALDILQENKIQLVIVNHRRCDDAMDDAQFAEEICKKYPQIKVLFYGPDSDATTVKKVISAGAHGYIWKKESASKDLIHAIKEIQTGRIVTFPDIAGVLIVDDPSKKLKFMHALFENSSDYHVIAEIENTGKVLEVLQKNNRIKLVVINLQHCADGEKNHGLIQGIKIRYPRRIKILYYDPSPNTETETAIKKMGADGYAGRNTIITEINRIMEEKKK
ncbi:MAG: response regulator transcription factor [Nitrosomonas sp.]|nr:response regulator transcription factor [Nitrosomonas sp.]